ncbi:TauD/TfdA family dioxygenase [Streptomyces acidiscabies]|uniref:TauD/TfdA family dioxygenase n=1 Tax=Streptomyces acidiscabies TaxID=42234 RepID=UPI0038F80C95
MRDAPSRPSPPFVSHFVDIRSRHAPSTITRQLRESGLVTVDGLNSRDAVARFASRIMSVVPHPHAAPDGLTVIHNTGAHAHRVGLGAFGKGELEAHTDRAGTPLPPRLMLLVCLQPAAEGGDSLLADGRDVFSHLSGSNAEAVVRFAEPCTVHFGSGSGHASQVFTVLPKKRVSVRFRVDGLARWSPVVQPYLPALRQAIEGCQRRLRLEPGQGYLLDNHRWLHARTSFVGDRLCLRALGDPRTPFPEGFSPDSPHIILPRLVSSAPEELRHVL